VRVTTGMAGRPASPGDELIVGTFRDIAAEHYAVQREKALSALGDEIAVTV
jgi:hypothetical protein